MSVGEFECNRLITTVGAVESILPRYEEDLFKFGDIVLAVCDRARSTEMGYLHRVPSDALLSATCACGTSTGSSEDKTRSRWQR